MALRGSAGQLAVSLLFPNYQDILGKPLSLSTIRSHLTELARTQPDIYPTVVNALIRLGQVGATLSGGYSVGLKDLTPDPNLEKFRQQAEQLVLNRLRGLPKDTQDEELGRKLLELVNKYYPKIEQNLKDRGSRLADVLQSKVQGNPTMVKRLVFTEGVYPDAWGRLIPYPIMNNFTQGLTPAEYWAAGYGSKQGLVTTKLAPGDAGWIYKQMVQVAHRLIVTRKDGPRKGVLRGLPTTLGDEFNIGTVLAHDIGPFKAGTIITREVVEKLRSLGYKPDTPIIVRSVIAGGPAEGVYAVDVGAHAGKFPELGIIVGLEAAQAIGERLSQSSVGKKHQGVVAGGITSATAIIHRVLNVPKSGVGFAAHATIDGTVTKIEKAPGGGHYIYIKDQAHFAPPGATVAVKTGQHIEAGDILTDGIPNPAYLVKYKGIGEGRKRFVELFVNLFNNFGLAIHRRNVELLARGLINYVQFTEAYKNYLPNDIVQYNSLEYQWKPRSGAKLMDVTAAKGRYLEEPVLHYTIGTRITPSVIETLKKYKIQKVLVHEDPPPFEPVLVRAIDVLRYDPDFLVRFLGAYQKRLILEAAAYGGLTRKYQTTSFVPSLAEAAHFGKKWPSKVI